MDYGEQITRESLTGTRDLSRCENCQRQTGAGRERRRREELLLGPSQRGAVGLLPAGRTVTLFILNIFQEYDYTVSNTVSLSPKLTGVQYCLD